MLIHFIDVKVVKTIPLSGGSKEMIVHGVTETDTFEFILFQETGAKDGWLLDELAYIYYRNDEANAFQLFIQPNQAEEYQSFLIKHENVRSHLTNLSST